MKFEEVASIYKNLFDEPGASTDFGCDESRAETLIAKAHSLSDKPVRAVVGWDWWDLLCAQENSEELVRMSCVIFARQVIYDSSDPDSIGHSVRTTPLVEIHENAIFETRNRLYVLVGAGTRKEVPIGVAAGLF